MDDSDFVIEDLKDDDSKKKKVDGKAKGNRTELHLCKLLSKKFGDNFSRSVGSGNRWSQTNLPEHAKQVYSGDVCVPEKFKWVFESKGGYENDINLANALEGDGITRLDEFIEQSSKDAGACHRKPIICWKRNRREWLAMVRQDDMVNLDKFPYHFHYRDWIMVSLEKLLENTEKSFWFEG